MTKTIIYEYQTEITHHIPMMEQDKALEALNVHLVGTNEINIVNKQRMIIENPKVTKHKNYKKLREAHHKFHATNTIQVTVRVFSDGSHDVVPCKKSRVQQL